VLNPRGGVLIVDFAPHALEFCRSEFAHRRLGFSDQEVRSWFETAGLKPSATQSIVADGSGKLTVKLWLGAMAALPLNRRAREAV
jgi:ArsR family transcriptional regulator